MNNTWTTWLLAGALLASLQGNLRSCFTKPAAAPEAATEARCDIDAATLGLTETQQRDLEELCRTRCATADDLEARAEQRLRDLHARLSDPAIDEQELRALVVEVSELREQALSASVDSILGVREILDGEQLATLLAACFAVGPCGAGTSCCDR